MTTKTPNLELTEVQQADVGESADSFNDSFWALDSIVQLSVKSRTVTAAPAANAEGDRYIVPIAGVAASDPWFGHARQIAYWSAGGWLYKTPRPGWEAFIQDESSGSPAFVSTARYIATQWETTDSADSLLTTKGDILVRGDSGVTRLAVGVDTAVLMALAAQSTGLKWQRLLTAKGNLFGFDGTAYGELVPTSNGDVLTLDSSEALGIKWAAAGGGAGGVSRLAQQIITTNTAVVEFAGIPTGYSNLVVVMSASGTDANVQGIQLQANGDTGANYNFTFVFSNNSVPGSAATYNATSATVGFAEGTSDAANSFGSSRITLYDYLSAAKTKAFSGHGYRRDSNGSNAFALTYGGDWASTAAIDKLWLFPAAGDFIAGSSFTLYGEA